MPPFTPVAPFPGGSWTLLRPDEAADAEPLFNVAKCTKDSPSWPCCAGMTHNGGGHKFAGGSETSGCLAETGYNRLRARRADGSTFSKSQGRDFLLGLGNRVLMLIGDSVVHQRFLALECAGRRAGCTTVERVEDTSADKTFNKTKAKGCAGGWRYGMKTLERVKMSCRPGHLAELVFSRQ